MGQSPIDFEFHTWQGLDLSSIPGLSSVERQEVLARYVKLRDGLAALLAEQREALTQGPPGYWLMRKLSKLNKQHRSAQLAVERLERAIVQSEHLEQSSEQSRQGEVSRDRGKRQSGLPRR